GGSLDAELAALGDDPDPQAVERIKAEWQKRHDQVIEAGGLHIIGTERHESRRIDNQLRGRAGRQGDPGSSRFYLSLEDNLMRIFASDRVKTLMEKLGMQEGEAIEHPWVTKAIENAQRKVEAHNFDIRKHLLEYDDVANDQRKVVYERRRELLEAEDIKDLIDVIRQEVVDNVISAYIPPGSIDEQWDVPGLEEAIAHEFGLKLPIRQWLDEEDDLDEDGLRARIQDAVREHIAAKEAVIGSDMMRRFEKDVMLQILDHHWKEHLAAMDYLRQGIGLRGYAQKDPKQEYKREAFQMFQDMLSRMEHDVIGVLAKFEVRTEDELAAMEAQSFKPQKMQFQHQEAQSALSAGDGGEPGAEEPGKVQPFRRDGRKIGRNEPCPCGSGKKYKHCHGKLS
ncbi:MAG TPA: preprotein translocase subunit SecA, partial [Chromatiales bacterium]|nr:preprotein translocase subunit SecA [Chromatiales bacterium]